MRFSLTFIFLSFTMIVNAQVVNTGMTDRTDSIEEGKVQFQGYIDVYHAFGDRNWPANDRPYAVSSARLNETTVNLAYLDIRYIQNRVRARFIPGVGTYISMNYAMERGVLSNVIEANIGIKPWINKAIWFDVGIMGSPFTNETVISKDQLLYSRSLSAEFSPYYLSGIRSTIPLSEKITLFAYLINGWQQITDANNSKAIATQIEFRPTSKWLLNWNTFIGEEQAASQNWGGLRLFTDFYAIYEPNPKWKLTSCAYLGHQSSRNPWPVDSSGFWGQANIMGQYSITKEFSLATRIEYFHDPMEIVSSSLLHTSSFSLCLNYTIAQHAMLRFEARHFMSGGNVLQNNTFGIASLAAWF